MTQHDTTRIGYGVMQLEHVHSTDEAVRLVRLAIDLGATVLDTAWFYGAGACNSIVRTAIRASTSSTKSLPRIATKLGAANTPDGRLAPAQQPLQLRQQVDTNLDSLGVDRLDLVYLRRVDRAPGIIGTGDQVVDIDDQLAELSALRDAGKIGAIGLSNVDADQVEHAAPAGIAAVQNAYNLTDRAEELALEACRNREISWIPFFPLGSGFPGTRSVVHDETVIAVAQELDATPAQVALAWLLQHYDHTVLIPGTTNPVHLQQNMAAADLSLSPEAMARLDDAVR